MPDIETTFSTMVLRTTHGGPTQSAKMGVQHLFRRITHIALLNHHSGRCNHPNESRFSVAGIARPVRGTAQEGIAISLSKQKTFTSDPHLELPFEDNARFASLVSSDSLQANYCSFRWGRRNGIPTASRTQGATLKASQTASPRAPESCPSNRVDCECKAGGECQTRGPGGDDH